MDYSTFKPLDSSVYAAMGDEFTRLAPMYKGYHKRPDIPEEFMDWGGTKWNVIASQWFFAGLRGGYQFVPKEGIDTVKAMTHIQKVMRSFEPDHKNKESICAYLLSLWFEDFIPDPTESSRFLNELAHFNGG